MRLLLIHSAHFRYKLREAIKPIAEDVKEDEKEGDYTHLLTVFCTIEKKDEKEPEKVVKMAFKEIETHLERLKLTKICLYPYAHLSSSLASPEKAKEILNLLYLELKKDEKLQVFKSPFGWYKAFELSCTGHPLSELSREIDARATTFSDQEKEAKTREEIVKEIQSRYLILFENGKEIPLQLEKMKPKELKNIFKKEKNLKHYKEMLAYLLSEEMKVKPSKESPSISAVLRLELVDYEPAADSGHFKLYPKGKLIFSLLKSWSKEIADQFEAVEIDTPILYSWDEKDIREQADSFHERHYRVFTPDKKEFVLRFAADFGLFKMMRNATLSYRQLPVRVYEFSKSFRYEKRGELSGLKRLRAFHMPDLHSFCQDEKEAMKDFKLIYKGYENFASSTGVDYVVVFRVVEDFYAKYKKEICEMLSFSKKPGFVELLSKKKHYWVLKHEFQGIDSTGGSCQLSTVQLDVEDGARYGITYVDQNGEERNCIILHCSIGSIERWIYTLLENALKKTKPVLPLWLSPTMIRLIPVASEFINDCERIAGELESVARVDIDDRDEKIGKKIRDAEREWLPLIIVFGEKERKAFGSGEGGLPVRFRTGEIKEMSLSDIKRFVENETKGYPFKKLPLPIYLSKRVKFR